MMKMTWRILHWMGPERAHLEGMKRKGSTGIDTGTRVEAHMEKKVDIDTDMGTIDIMIMISD